MATDIIFHMLAKIPTEIKYLDYKDDLFEEKSLLHNAAVALSMIISET